MADTLIRLRPATGQARNREGATPLWLASVNGDATIIAAPPILLGAAFSSTRTPSRS